MVSEILTYQAKLYINIHHIKNLEQFLDRIVRNCPNEH